MLTPQDIRDKQFVKAVFGGYDMTGVDDFLDQLAADYAAVIKENAILKSKIKVLVEKVEEYRATEDAMRMALLTAQKMGDDLVTEAQKKKNTLLAGVEEELELRRGEIARMTAEEEKNLERVKAATAAFILETQKGILTLGGVLKSMEQPAPEPEKEEPDAEAQSVPEPELPAAEADADEQDVDVAAVIASVVSDEEDEKEPPKEEKKPLETPKAPADEDDEDRTPRPTFNFDNLQFGKNFNHE